ncbi:hypothetical protein CW304_07160 [Bacillus sp. UFRGS-B20]|nr:hypothetical protein CW304_07160 [Bacillus sp. UFRGS-B20]
MLTYYTDIQLEQLAIKTLQIMRVSNRYAVKVNGPVKESLECLQVQFNQLIQRKQKKQLVNIGYPTYNSIFLDGLKYEN